MARRTPTTPHDALFKEVFGQPLNALAFFRGHLPPALGATLRAFRRDREGTSDLLAELRSDLLFRGRAGGRPVFALFEHQRDPDRLEPFQALRYVTRIWGDWLRDVPRARQLPLVLPLVLYQGTRPWPGPRRLTELIQLPPELDEARRFLPELELQLFELADADAERLARVSGSPLARAALTLMQRVADPTADLLEAFDELAHPLGELFRGREGPKELRTLVRYTLGVRGEIDVSALSARLRRILGSVAGGVVMSTAKELVDKGRAEGRAEMLARVLRAHFGAETVTPAVTERLDGATAEQLEAWADRVPGAERIDDVFAGPARTRGRRKKRS